MSNQNEFISDEELFDDTTLGGEIISEEVLVEENGAESGAEGGVNLPDLSKTELSGIELFLSGYGVKGGVIEFDEGESQHFTDLDAATQENILKTLTAKSVPSVEEAYNLSNSEIDLLNVYRNSGEKDAREFFNNEVSERLSDIRIEEKYATIDYKEYDADDIYLFNLRRDKPDMTDDELADELVKARELTSYESTTSAMRENLINEQASFISDSKEADKKVFNQELEEQRHDVVESIENIEDIAGAPISNEMKEYLLGDIMELNDNDDPILMEKIFSDPNTMFEVNWFLKYGKDYIENLNTYWKGEVSKAHKAGFNDVTRKMPGVPIGGANLGQSTQKEYAKGKDDKDVLGEVDLFDDV